MNSYQPEDSEDEKIKMTDNKTPKLLYAISPGRVLQALMEDMRVTVEHIASRTGIDMNTLTRILNEEEQLTQETADKLALLSVISANTWMMVERNYQQLKQENGNHE